MKSRTGIRRLTNTCALPARSGALPQSIPEWSHGLPALAPGGPATPAFPARHDAHPLCGTRLHWSYAGCSMFSEGVKYAAIAQPSPRNPHRQDFAARRKSGPGFHHRRNGNDSNFLAIDPRVLCLVVSHRNHRGPHSIPDPSPPPATRKDHVLTSTGRARSPGSPAAKSYPPQHSPGIRRLSGAWDS